MKRAISSMLVAVLLAGQVATAAADVNVQRNGSENPIQEVAKSIYWGGIAGLMVGGALALGTKSTDNDGDYVRYGFVTGVLVGGAFGIYFVTQRPSAAMLEIENGQVNLASAPFIEVRPPMLPPALGAPESPSVAARLVKVSL